MIKRKKKTEIEIPIILNENQFFIFSNVPSLKNSKRWTGKSLISSKKVMEYVENTKKEYILITDSIISILKTKEKPYKISFKFIRGSKHKFDYVNAVQLPLDIFVKHKILEDDNADEVIPVFEQYLYNKINPGVIITIL